MKKFSVAALLLPMTLLFSCKMENPLISESALPYGAPRFDKITLEHYKPAFEAGITEGKANIDKIVADTASPTFWNVIVPMEFAAPILDRTSNIFFNLMEANTSDAMQQIAEEITPALTEYSMYISMNEGLFKKVKAVYDARENAGLRPDQLRLLEQTYRDFVRGGALLEGEDKEKYAALVEKGTLLGLQFGKNLLNATNAYTLQVTDSARLEGMPAHLLTAAAETAKEKGSEGWVFTLNAPSYVPFMKFCRDRDLRKQMYMAYNTRCVCDANDNTQVVKDIVQNRIDMVKMLGYERYSDYALEERMAKTTSTVQTFLASLMDATMPFAREEVKEVEDFARENGFKDRLQAWDFSFWSERLKEAKYAFNEEELKPYFRLENCIDAVFGLASRLYDLEFQPIDLPVYHPDVKVYDVKTKAGRHMGLLYADFFPRESKRGGAWMTSFGGQSIKDGVETRPFINIVCNFTKPTAQDPSLITHDEFVTFLHEFGHALHGLLAEGEYPSQTGTSVARDFVELPSQFNENFGYQKEFLQGFAKHYKSGEVIPDEMIQKIITSQNFLSGYFQTRQLQYGIIDMAWHTLTSVPAESAVEFEKAVFKPYAMLPQIKETASSPGFGHIFDGGYAAGYYSYKWAEVLEADAFELFKENGIFDEKTAHSFRDNILARGDSEDPAQLYRNFRGRDPQIEALMNKLGLTAR